MRRTCFGIFGMVGMVVALQGMALGSDYDIHQMQERLRAQEARMAEQDARLNDLHAKVVNGLGMDRQLDGPENIISIQKNAKVTIGGLVTSKYTFTNGKIDSVAELDGSVPDYTAPRQRRATTKTGDFAITDAELAVQIDVNENFDAFLNIDLHNGSNYDFYSAKSYYVRWKNICNTGFGLKVGRDALVFGEEGYGELASYVAGSGDGLGETSDFFNGYGGFLLPEENFEAFNGSLIPLHNGWDIDGVTQITPYWEGLDGKLTLELSFMQNVYDDGTLASAFEPGGYYIRQKDDYLKVRSRNYGLGTMSFRAQYEPIENLKFTASVVNYRSNGDPWLDDELPGDFSYSNDYLRSKNNTAFGLAVGWRPCFAERLYLWGQWIHGNDVYFYDGMKSDAFNIGFAFDLAEGLTYFAQGDYLRTRYNVAGMHQTGKAWAFYTGLQYSLPYGVSLEAGWKHENVRYRAGGSTTVKAKGDTIYGLVGFEF